MKDRTKCECGTDLILVFKDLKCERCRTIDKIDHSLGKNCFFCEEPLSSDILKCVRCQAKSIMIREGHDDPESIRMVLEKINIDNPRMGRLAEEDEDEYVEGEAKYDGVEEKYDSEGRGEF